MTQWGFSIGRSWIAGQPRATPQGGALDGTWKDSYAYARLPFQDGLQLSASLAHVLDGLSGKAEAIAQFVESGGYAELFIGWEFSANSGDELGWQLLEKLSAMRLALSFDIYPVLDDLEDR